MQPYRNQSPTALAEVFVRIGAITVIVIFLCGCAICKAQQPKGLVGKRDNKMLLEESLRRKYDVVSVTNEPMWKVLSALVGEQGAIDSRIACESVSFNFNDVSCKQILEKGFDTVCINYDPWEEVVYLAPKRDKDRMLRLSAMVNWIGLSKMDEYVYLCPDTLPDDVVAFVNKELMKRATSADNIDEVVIEEGVQLKPVGMYITSIKARTALWLTLAMNDVEVMRKGNRLVVRHQGVR